MADMIEAERIVGARVLAGYMSAVDVANELSISKSKYQKLENGLIGINPVDRGRIAELFNVSELFLSTGEISDKRDAAALRLSKLLVDAGGDSSGAANERLISIRLNRGFRSARSAAVHFGWNEQTYGAHERGSVTLPTERLIGYALGFGVRPEYLVYGREPIEPLRGDVIEGWADRRAVKQKLTPTETVSWRWLKKQTPHEVTLALLEIDDGKLMTSKLRPMVLPAVAFKTLPRAPYGIVSRQDDNGLDVIVVEPAGASDKDLLVFTGTSIETVKAEMPRWIVDPISIAAKDFPKLILGSQIGKVSIG